MSKVFSQLFSLNKDKKTGGSSSNGGTNDSIKKSKRKLAKSQSCESAFNEINRNKNSNISSSNNISSLSLSPSSTSVSSISTATITTTTTPSTSDYDISLNSNSHTPPQLSSGSNTPSIDINNSHRRTQSLQQPQLERMDSTNSSSSSSYKSRSSSNTSTDSTILDSTASGIDPQGGGLGSRRSWSEQLDHDKEQFVDEISHNSDNTSVLSHPSFLEPSRVQRIKVSNVVIIYNPHSGSKVGEKIMSEAKKYFEAHHISVQSIPTEYKGHAEDLCRTIDISEIDVVCLVGGDGTIHEAINGIMKRDPESRDKFVLACIPAGTGNSFVLELQGKISIKYQCERVVNGLTVPIDIAKVTVIKKDSLAQECNRRKTEFQMLKKKYGHLTVANEEEQISLSSSQEAGRKSIMAMKQIRPDALMEFASQQQIQLANTTTNTNEVAEQPEVFYSFNSIHWGLGSKINITAEKMRWMGKAVRYTTAALFELFKGQKILARVEYEDANGEVTALEDEFCLAIVNNIQGAAKGMKMAPKAKLNDGLFDLLLIKSHKTFDLMNIFTKVYDGTHTELNYVIYKQVKRFSITPFKKDKERKKRLRKEKKRIRAAIKAGKDHVKNPLEILKTECNTILSELEDQIDEEIIDIDGELKGATPFFCEVIPRSVRVVV
ncbi:sphingosine kinase related protein [Tieghemostelium lacteum]|uniref:Sphingosine kinase related protein n=1 Tax=Tieghemostelium lacteum TaxID=361077 RepID=A0A152A704_TIELA|nr:sphingosine kinase related protein [Tieghemostelium lacteum]|eukprot:KYR02009.1 sphingosine kinase related protein [Tieghemostelium lacteum]